jgi:preprotein translocase subunit SecG
VLTALRIVQVLLSIFLAILILLQSKGTGLGSVFGGDGSVFQTRRGIELTLFKFTIGIAAAWLIISILVTSKLFA